jgi:hypothetical protein
VFLIICLTLVAAGISVCSILLLWQRNESLHGQMTQLQTSLNRLATQSGDDWRGTGPVPGSGTGLISYGEVVNRYQVSQDGRTYRLTQFCQGMMQKSDASSTDALLCLGKNQLVFSDGVTNALLQSQMVTSTDQAPVLKEPVLLTGTPGKTRLLISYAPDTCVSLGDCGLASLAAMTHVYSIEDGALKSLARIPTDGTFLWNPASTKAVVTPHACGAKGCEAVSLLGYTLEADTIKTLTTDTAAEAEIAFDANGKRLSYWKNIRWVDNNTVTANIISADGKTAKVVTATF